MTNETISLLADIGTILGVLFSIGLAVYHFLKNRKLSIPRLPFLRPILFATFLHITVVYIVGISTDTPGITAAVSVLLATLVYLVADVYEKMYDGFIEEYKRLVDQSQNAAEHVIDETKRLMDGSKDAVERATDAAERTLALAETTVDQNKTLVKVIEKLTEQSSLDEEEDS